MAPPDWYPDPTGKGGLRYWDGSAWTSHWVPPPPVPHWAPLPWKGAQLGRPAFGPGALANPGRRLGARALDALVMLPVFALLLTVTLVIAAPHFGPIFPDLPVNGQRANVPTPGFVWVYLTVAACLLATGVLQVVYEAVMTALYGRTLGKAWLHIRPLRRDGSALTTGRAWGRAGMHAAFYFASWLGTINDLFCLWDDQRQTLHDKVVDTIVVNDPAAR